MLTPTANSAHWLVTESEVMQMSREFYDALTKYKSAMAQARVMLSQRLITAEEYAIIDTNMCERYCVDLDSLYRDNDLIITDIYGNISLNKEVI
jgi:hypothetical protein